MGVVNQGLALALVAIFPTAPNKWYLGLINNTPTPVLDPGDTMPSHPGWAEATSYSGNRPLWTNGTPSGNQVTNSSYIAFAMTATTTIYGIFLTDQGSGTAGNLFGTGQFVGGPQGTVSGDTLQVQLTVMAASS